MTYSAMMTYSATSAYIDFSDDTFSDDYIFSDRQIQLQFRNIFTAENYAVGEVALLFVDCSEHLTNRFINGPAVGLVKKMSHRKTTTVVIVTKCVRWGH